MCLVYSRSFVFKMQKTLMVVWLKLQRNVRKCCVADVRMCCVADVRMCCVADVRMCCVADVLFVWLHLLVLVCRCQPQSSVYCESSVPTCLLW